MKMDLTEFILVSSGRTTVFDPKPAPFALLAHKMTPNGSFALLAHKMTPNGSFALGLFRPYDETMQ
jgi:hypothetical protein